MTEPEKELLVTRTVTLTWRIPMSAYPGMTSEQAADYERSLPTSDKLQTMVLALNSGWPPDFGETITIQDVPAPPVVPDIPHTSRRPTDEEVSFLRGIVFRALDNAVASGYEASIMQMSPAEVALDLTENDAELESVNGTWLTPLAAEWQKARREAK